MAVSVNIKQLDGTLKKVAGNTILLDGTCSEIQSGTVTIPANTTGDWSTTVTMPTAMTDTDYIVIFNILPVDGVLYNSNANYRAKTTTSFIVHCEVENIPVTQTIEWYAFRLVELEGYNTIYNKMTNIDSTPADNSTNLVTSGGVYDAIKNASSVFIGTSSEWESETSKTDYQVAILTDKPNVNAVDSTDGTTTVVGEPNKRYVGTRSGWDLLSSAEKAKYEVCCFADESFEMERIDNTTNIVAGEKCTIDVGSWQIAWNGVAYQNLRIAVDEDMVGNDEICHGLLPAYDTNAMSIQVLLRVRSGDGIFTSGFAYLTNEGIMRVSGAMTITAPSQICFSVPYLIK